MMFRRSGIGLLGCVWLLAAGPVRPAEPQAPPMYALIVGGGPDLDSNTAQIEGHVRFVGQILPAGAKRIVLFADGKSDAATVSEIDLNATPENKRAMAVLLPNNNLAPQPVKHAPALGMKTDGASRLQELRRAVGKLSASAAAQPAPVLLYFAGHGAQNGDKEEDTQYEMWGGDELSVHDLASEIARLPRQPPVILIMAQCYSGAFANVLFRQGEPNGAPLSRDIAGFFSAHKDRVASGCSAETTEADYQDFSSYFLGALCGRDRFGHPMQGADFDGDGKVSLHEAFCYALIHDASIDTPVCTSDVYLKRFAPMAEAEVFGTPYSKIWQAATPAQRAVLGALSEKLGLSGEKRPLQVYDWLKYSDPIARPEMIKSEDDLSAALNALRLNALEDFFVRWPALRFNGTSEYTKALGEATAIVGEKGLDRALLEADKAHENAEDAVDNDEAAMMRFAGVCESVLEAQQLRAHGKQEAREQFERLCASEQRSLLVPAR